MFVFIHISQCAEVCDLLSWGVYKSCKRKWIVELINIMLFVAGTPTSAGHVKAHCRVSATAGSFPSADLWL